MENSQSDLFYYPQLDGLRFFAFLLVFIHNAPHMESNFIWETLHDYGWIGVDIFFCLSAFLITKLLLLEYEKNKSVDIKKFYFRRGLRITPLYSFYLLLASIYILLNIETIETLSYHLLALVTFSYNIAYPFLMLNNFIVFVHLWTISFEWQFYTVVPWIIKSLSINKELAIKRLFLFFIVGFIIRALLIFYNVKHPIIYMLPFSHFDSVLFGILIAIEAHRKFIKKILPEMIFIAGIFLGILTFLLPNIFEIGWNLMLTYPLAGLSSYLIIYSLIYNSKSVISSFFRISIFVYLGKISFGLYVYHTIALIVADIIYKSFLIFHSVAYYAVSMTAIGLMLTITFSIVSYIIIEKPFLALKSKFKIYFH